MDKIFDILTDTVIECLESRRECTYPEEIEAADNCIDECIAAGVHVKEIALLFGN